MEDKLFHAASVYAQELGIPRIYLSANSGARIGVAEELLDHIQAKWCNSTDPTQGFEYLYLTSESFEALNEKSKINGS